MNGFPDFSQLAFDPTDAAPAAKLSGAHWLTPEAIAVMPAYGPDDARGLDFPAT